MGCEWRQTTMRGQTPNRSSPWKPSSRGPRRFPRGSYRQNTEASRLEPGRGSAGKASPADQVSPEGFGKLYKPMEDQERGLATELPRLQGEADALEMQQLSANEVVSE